MKKNILKGIYAITPSGLNEETLYKKVYKLLEKGVNILQYRDKLRSPKQKIIIAKELRNICNKFDSLLIINDDAKLAKKVGANGVHLGQKDMPYEEARKYAQSLGLKNSSDWNNDIKKNASFPQGKDRTKSS